MNIALREPPHTPPPLCSPLIIVIFPPASYHIYSAEVDHLHKKALHFLENTSTVGARVVLAALLSAQH